MSESHLDDVNLPKKINIGCGFDIRPDYLNVDSGDWHKPDLVADVTGMPMLPSGHFEEAVAQDVLEHIGRTKQVSTLSEWARLLCAGGALHVRVPSVVDMVKMLCQPDFRDNVDQQHFWIQMLYGTQAYPGDFHLCGYTCATLADLGRQAGLFLAHLAIKDQWLFDATFRKVESSDGLSNREYVVFQYATILQRVPDIGGLAYWNTLLDDSAISGPGCCTNVPGGATRGSLVHVRMGSYVAAIKAWYWIDRVLASRARLTRCFTSAEHPISPSRSAWRIRSRKANGVSAT